jgi:hypothetical protein
MVMSAISFPEMAKCVTDLDNILIFGAVGSRAAGERKRALGAVRASATPFAYVQEITM